MKTSNKILLGAFVGILTVCVVILIVIRLSIEPAPTHKRSSLKKSAQGQREINLTDFNCLDLKGNWQARVVREDKVSILVKGPEDLLSALSVDRYGNYIELHMPRQAKDERKLRLEMGLPTIQALRTKGVADIAITGFDLEDLAIDSEGVTSIHGKNGKLNKLKFRGKGVSRLDLEKLPTSSADLTGEGVFKIDLTMTGGV